MGKEIKKTQREIKIHHTVTVDDIPYYRNETIFYDTNGILVEQKIKWSVGDKHGKGPYVEPGGDLDEFKKYKPKKLEKIFKNLKTKE